MNEVLLPQGSVDHPAKPALSTSASAPSILPSSSYTFPPALPSGHAADSSFINKEISASQSHIITPTTSNPSSPRPQLTSLPAPGSTPVSPPNLGRRESLDSNASKFRQTRRLSIPPHMSSPGVSLRHVGEGALDDSDSSDNSEQSNSGSSSGGNEESESPLALAMSLRTAPPHPSPLGSRPHRFTENELDDVNDDGTSASPLSSQSECESETGDARPRRRPRQVRRLSSRATEKRRAQSRGQASPIISTVGKSVGHRPSHSTIQRFMATDDEHTPYKPGTLDAATEPTRAQSHALPNMSEGSGNDNPAIEPVPPKDLKSFNPLEEQVLHDNVWNTVRFAFELFSNEVCLIP
jgi:WD repeat-containing protein 24